jgi:hypothetical protein
MRHQHTYIRMIHAHKIVHTYTCNNYLQFSSTSVRDLSSRAILRKPFSIEGSPSLSGIMSLCVPTYSSSCYLCNACIQNLNIHMYVYRDVFSCALIYHSHIQVCEQSHPKYACRVHEKHACGPCHESVCIINVCTCIHTRIYMIMYVHTCILLTRCIACRRSSLEIPKLSLNLVACGIYVGQRSLEHVDAHQMVHRLQLLPRNRLNASICKYMYVCMYLLSVCMQARLHVCEYSSMLQVSMHACKRMYAAACMYTHIRCFIVLILFCSSQRVFSVRSCKATKIKVSNMLQPLTGERMQSKIYTNIVHTISYT